MCLASFTILGLNQAATIVLVVGAACIGGFAVWYWWAGRGFDGYGDELDRGESVGGGVVFAQYVREDDLRSVAVQKRVYPSAAWVERGESSKAGGEVAGGSKSLGGRLSHERGRESRVHVELPPAQAGDLIPRVLAKLHENGEIERHLAVAPSTQTDIRTVVSKPDEAVAYVREHMESVYPDGIDESPDEMAQGIVMALHRKAREDEIEQKRAQFRQVDLSQFVLIESQWRVFKQGDKLQLWLHEWAPPEFWPEQIHYGGGDWELPVLELPAGVGISVALDDVGVTERGRRELQHRDIRKLGVFGTVESFLEGPGRLEVLPIAVSWISM